MLHLFLRNAHLVWENNKLRLDLFAEYNAEIAYEDLAPSEREKLIYTPLMQNGNPILTRVVHAQLYRSISTLVRIWLATASVENITDQRYRTYSSGIAAAGRNLILALQYTF